MRILSAAILCLVALTLAACDIVAPEPITLEAKEVTFRFAFHADTLAAGEVLVPAEAEANLTGRLDGFSQDEILAARVVGAELERIEPPLKNLNALLQAATIRLEAGELSSAPVAEATSLPARFRADMAPQGVDVGAYLRRPTFGASLRIVPEQLPSDRYVFLVRLRLSIDVEGL